MSSFAKMSANSVKNRVSTILCSSFNFTLGKLLTWSGTSFMTSPRTTRTILAEFSSVQVVVPSTGGALSGDLTPPSTLSYMSVLLLQMPQLDSSLAEQSSSNMWSTSSRCPKLYPIFRVTNLLVGLQNLIWIQQSYSITTVCGTNNSWWLLYDCRIIPPSICCPNSPVTKVAVLGGITVYFLKLAQLMLTSVSDVALHSVVKTIST